MAALKSGAELIAFANSAQYRCNHSDVLVKALAIERTRCPRHLIAVNSMSRYSDKHTAAKSSCSQAAAGEILCVASKALTGFESFFQAGAQQTSLDC